MKRVGRFYGRIHEQVSRDGHTVLVTLTDWGITVAMRNVLCADGKERLIYTREPDTFFTVPGYTYAHGKTISGFVTHDSLLDRHVFVATGKNAGVIVPAETPYIEDCPF